MFSLALVFQIFVLLNPLSSFPILMAAHKKKMNVRNIAIKAVLTAFIVAVLMALIGPSLFKVFGVTLDSFRVAGGIVLLILGINTIKPKKRDDHITTIDSITSIIATPMLTGPATISFITIKTYELGFMNVLFNIIGAFVLVGILFILFGFAVEKIPAKIVDIASRILGLFLIAVSIEMIAHGIKGLI